MMTNVFVGHAFEDEEVLTTDAYEIFWIGS
jgi:hypothetical protein